MVLKLWTRQCIYPSDLRNAEELQTILQEVASNFSEEDDCEDGFCEKDFYEKSHSPDSIFSSESV